MSDFTVPDMIEPIVAFRAWNIQQNGLVSLNHSAVWPKRERLEALCPRSEPTMENVVGWEVVPFRQESFWLRDQIFGEQLVDYLHTGISYGLTGPTGLTYHPSPVAYSAVTVHHNPVAPDPPKPFELPTEPCALVLPEGWNWRIGYREIMHPPIHTAAPGEDCVCGIYALKGRDMGSHYVSSASAWGEVYLWGKVIEGEYGYRAQYAYPKTIETKQSDLEGLLSEYGVPVTVQGAVQVAISQALPTGPTRKPILWAICINAIAIIVTCTLFMLGLASWWNIAFLSANVISILACLGISFWMSRMNQ